MRRRRRRRRIRTLQPAALFSALLFVIAAVVFGIWGISRDSRPCFMDVMIELGQPLPDVSAFTTQYADLKKVELITSAETLDISKVGAYPVKLRNGNREETVTLTVRDTKSPVVLLRNVTVAPGEVVVLDDFIVEIQDFSGTTATFVEQPEVLQTFGKVPVAIRVQDDSGNETTATCILDYSWLRSDVTIEVGHVLTKEDMLLDTKVEETVVDQAALDHIFWHGVGSYEIGADRNEESRVCKVTVVDTVAPDLQLQELTIYTDERVTAEDFVVSVTDASRTESVQLLSQLEFGKETQEQVVRIEATDASGNKTVAETTLRIVKDTPPVFSGLDDMVIYKNETPDYLAGVIANDDRDGELKFKVDSTKVQLQKPGTYSVIYTATDSYGNVTEVERRVVVEERGSNANSSRD